ncbi:hypothetical protein PHPALM_30525 [Phytophthora palmivora]|uniref:Uncharacterized protein n=1 Tax=Phytophthora palmivora TaxID=4796 RepID=A0A2P4X4X8_9STRA|nr:hypothetical protein PHPALM_30525 [Phytophthora palmivora]
MTPTRVCSSAIDILPRSLITTGCGKFSVGVADRMKLQRYILIDNLELRVMYDDVKSHYKRECREAKKNDFMLFNITKEKARAQR